MKTRVPRRTVKATKLVENKETLHISNTYTLKFFYTKLGGMSRGCRTRSRDVLHIPTFRFIFRPSNKRSHLLENLIIRRVAICLPA